jgi:hypothetical protein
VTAWRWVRAHEGVQQDPDVGEGEVEVFRAHRGTVWPGMGLHQCVGQHVARLEAEALLPAVARRVRSIEFAGPTGHHNDALRTRESIPYACERGGRRRGRRPQNPGDLDRWVTPVRLAAVVRRSASAARSVGGGRANRPGAIACCRRRMPHRPGGRRPPAGREDGDGTAREVRRRQRSAAGAASTGARSVPACSWCGPRDPHGPATVTFHRTIDHPAAAPRRRDALRAGPWSGGSPAGGVVWWLGRLS